jgi:hypothetical protein
MTRTHETVPYARLMDYADNSGGNCQARARKARSTWPGRLPAPFLEGPKAYGASGLSDRDAASVGGLTRPQPRAQRSLTAVILLEDDH